MDFTTMLPADKQFYVQNGPVLKSGEELITALENGSISEWSFEYHHERLDFSSWIAEVLENKKLATSLKKIKTKKSFIKKLKEA